MEIAIAIAFVALCGWDIGRRVLSGVAARDRKALLAIVDDLDAVKRDCADIADRLSRHDRQLTDLSGNRVEARRAPKLTGVSR